MSKSTTRTATIVAGSAGLYGIALAYAAPPEAPLIASILFMLLTK